jgi:hypothetical protein
MSKKYDFYQDHLEWEILDPEQVITHLTFEKGLYNLNQDCIISFSRNNQYDLVATISGILNHPKDININAEEIPGTFIENETVTGYSMDGLFKYSFSGVIISGHTSSPISVNSTAVRFKADIIFDKVEKVFTGFNNETEFIQEWYLSSKSDVHFPRSTKRDLDKSFKRIREEIDPDDETTLVKSYGSSWDYIFISTPDISCIIAKVPSEYGPNWSFNLTIEYRKAFGNIPTDETKEAVSELVSFIFGCQLLKIGQTSYDKSHSLTLQEYKRPWGDNVVRKCQRGGFHPVDIKNYKEWGRAETLLNEMLPHYLRERNTLRLKDALWKFWIAKNSSLGTNLPILSSAVEALAEQVLKKHPEKKYYYIEPIKFHEAIKDELAAIELKLDDNPNKDKIMNKLKGSWQRGSNEKLEMMFEILTLPVDKIERKAIKARNKMAHSSLGDISMDEIKETIRLTRAYETLFHRIFLKILCYNGQYIDYYTLGHPKRNINEPIPE